MMKKLIVLIAFSLLFSACSVLRNNTKPELDETEIKTYPTRAIQRFNIAEIYRMNKEYARAVLEYEDALKYDSSSVTIYTRLGEAYLNLHKYAEAVQNYEKAVKLEPESSEYKNICAQIYLIMKEETKSEDYWKSIIDSDPDFSDAYYHLYNLYKNSQQNEKSVAIMKRLLETDSENTEALKILLDYYRMNQNSAKAIDYAKCLLEIKPGDGQYYYVLIQLYLNSKDEKEAEKVIQQWKVRSDDLMESTLFYANYLISRDRYDEAKEQLNSISKRWKENWWASHLKALVFEFYDNADSVTFHYKRAISFDDVSSLAFQGYAFWEFDHQHYESAIKVSSLGLERFENNYQLLLLKASSYQELGDLDGAIESYEILYNIRGDDINIIHQLALLHDQNKNYKRSDELYNVLLSKNADDELALNNYSYSLAERQLNLEKALEMTERAIQLNPDNAAFYDTKSWILFKKGHYREALDIIHKALSSDTNNAEIFYHKAEILRVLDNPDEAIQMYKKALSIDPDFVLVKKRLEEFTND